MLLRICTGCCIVLCCFACDGEDEPLPAYLYLDALEIEVTAEQGTARTNVPNAQLYVGDEYIGVVNLPGRVPVLQTGEQEVRIDPLVRENGSSRSLAIYPFFERITTTANLAPLTTDTIRPRTRYASDRTAFLFVEDFDAPGLVFNDDRDGNDQTQLTKVSEGALEGQSARFVLDADNRFIEVATTATNPFSFANVNAGVYLELDFKAEIPFRVGLVGREAGLPEASQYNYQLVARDEWTKVYLNLSPEIFESGFEAYQIGIQALLPEGESRAEVYLDNIKLLSYEE